MKLTGDPYQGTNTGVYTKNLQVCPGVRYSHRPYGLTTMPVVDVIKVLRAIENGECSASFAIEHVSQTLR
jgi:hypothetical protein